MEIPKIVGYVEIPKPGERKDYYSSLTKKLAEALVPGSAIKLEFTSDEEAKRFQRSLHNQCRRIYGHGAVQTSCVENVLTYWFAEEVEIFPLLQISQEDLNQVKLRKIQDVKNDLAD